MTVNTTAHGFLTALVDHTVRVTPEKGLGRRFVGKLLEVQVTDDPLDDDPMLVVDVNGDAWKIPWSEVDRIQVDHAATRPARHRKDSTT